jgi:phage protein D/phage baseplate assembly protein gpV
VPTSTVIASCEVKVGGSALAAAVMDDLVSVRVETSLWACGRATVRLRDPEFANLDSGPFAVGKDLAVSVTGDDGKTLKPVFTGEITDITLETSAASDRMELVVGALDKSHRLGVATKPTTFANKTWADIVKAIAGNAGLSPDVSVSGSAMLYVLQTVTDYAFLWDIAIRTGCEWWVDDSKLHFKERASTDSATLKYGEDLEEFRVRYSGAAKASEVTVRGWDAKKKEAIVGDDKSTLGGSAIPAIGATAPLATDGRSKAKSGWGKPVVATGFAVKDQAEAKAVAAAITARLDAGEVTARGVAELNPAVKVGTAVSIENVGTKAKGKYLVTSVEHLITQSNQTTSFTAGNRAPVGLADLVGHGPDAINPRWGTQGLVVGVVTAITGDPDKMGRIKVKFPSLSADDESAWARLASPGAGKKRGLLWVPEVDDEVIVAFEHGDHRFPVVLGGLWNGKDALPGEEVKSPVVSRLFMSRLGHKLEMSDGDSPAKKHIALELEDGANKVRLGADKTDIEVKSGNVFTIKSGSAKITIDGSGNISIEGGKIDLKATQDLSLKGMNVNIKGDIGVKIEGTQVEVKGSGMGKFDGGGMTEIKGGMVKIN